MSFVSWSDELSVGIEEIDEQHRKFIDIINDLHLAMKNGKAQETLPRILKELGNYAVFHFTHEEGVLQSCRYPDSSAHKLIHDKFVIEIQKLSADLLNQKVLLSLDIMKSLKDWLVTHIMGQDKKYGEYIKKQKKA
jgi:hemerythrin-like metal-binding protein